MEKEVYLVGEDTVTRAIIYRILSEFAPNVKVKQELPARGSEIKNKISNFNALSRSTPVILLIDLDTDDCAPILKNKLLGEKPQEENFIFNIAVDEAEAWLMADRENFSAFIGIELEKMPIAQPNKQGGIKALQEMSLPTKCSYYLTHILAPQSSKKEIREQIAATGKNCKGKEYNTALLPFIQKQWDISTAVTNSDSLKRMVNRIKTLSDN